MNFCKKESIPQVCAILAIFFWSTVASAYKVALNYLDIFQLIFWITGVSAVVLLVILFFQKKIDQLKKYSKTEYLQSATMGFINPFLFYLFLFFAYSFLPAQEAQIIFYTWPAILIILSIFLLGQKIKIISLVAIIISFFGVFISATHGDILDFKFTNILGSVLAFAAAFIWALFWVFNINDKRDDVCKIFLNCLFGFVYSGIGLGLFSNLVIPDVGGLLAAVYIGLFDISITFIIWSQALRLSKNTAVVSKFIYLVPFLSLFIIYFIVKEKILVTTIVGLVFVLVGIFMESIYKIFVNSRPWGLVWPYIQPLVRVFIPKDEDEFE